ncbi:MAG: hypothetical protein KBD53_01890 [Candidatus Omnitrophica bacterium]|nr:hypothetical protein [Candidatus Omnitrophota bacterium]
MKRIVFFLSIVFITTNASAETIYLKSGRIVTGKIVARTPVYVRLETKFMGDPDREFLVENIIKIVEDDENYVPTQAVLNYATTLDDVPIQIQQAARRMAVSLLEQAMRNVSMPNIDDAPEGVKQIAEQKASDLLAQAMASLNETPETVKDAARQIANSLLEETVRSTASGSVNDLTDDVKRAAQDKASALIEQAMIGTVEEAPDQVKQAAQLKARALIEDAMKEINILEGVISEGKSVQEDFESLSAGATDQQSETDKIQQSERNKITSFNREIAPEQVDSLMQEAIQKRVDETNKNEFKTVEGTDGLIEEMAAPPAPKNIVTSEELIEREPSDEDVVDESEETEETALTEEELKEKIANIPQPKMKEPTFKDFVLALNYRDFLVMGFCVILLLVLLSRRFRSKKTDEAEMNEPDIEVISSITYQHLPDDIKSKFTSSDIILILEYEEKYRNKVGQTSDEVVIDDETMLIYIQEQVQKVSGRFTVEDLKKVLQTKEKNLPKVG